MNCHEMLDELNEKKRDIEKTIKKVEQKLEEESSPRYKIQKFVQDFYNTGIEKVKTEEIGYGDSPTIGVSLFWTYISSGLISSLRKKLGYEIKYVETRNPQYGFSLYFQVSKIE